jgi:hypothetical protein
MSHGLKTSSLTFTLVVCTLINKPIPTFLLHPEPPLPSVGKALLHALTQQLTVFTPVHPMLTIVVAEIVMTSTTTIRGPCILNMTCATRILGIGQRGTLTKALQSHKIGELLLRILIEAAAMAGSPTTGGEASLMNGGVITLTPTMTTAVVIIASFSETMAGRLVKIGNNIGSRICRMIHPPGMNGLGSRVLDGKRAESHGTRTRTIAITGTRIKARKIRIRIVIGWRRSGTQVGKESSGTTTTT